MSSVESTESPVFESFEQLGLSPELEVAIRDIGYEKPSPIQAESIPFLLEGRDLLGVAQTGTGKTAAFALPILSRLDLKQKKPQVLCLAPTRELAIQVAEAFKSYAKKMKGFNVVAIYGGQDYRTQLKQLSRGVHVIVGTPGRVMDHMRKGSIDLSDLKTMVLDEADEMLRMGFIDDVEWVLEQTPSSRQTALFSATMPSAIKRIAKNQLKKPAEVTIKVKTTTAEGIRQRYWQLNNGDKMNTLSRIIDAESYDAMIIFVRTKNATVEVAERLQALGLSADALNGDMAQNVREKCIARLKNGKLDFLVATDVAARGLDVPRISHVINYDIPYDTESYVHRIGRTGRAGRKGEAILFVNNREKRMLGAIEKATSQRIEKFIFPSLDELNQRKADTLFQQIDVALSQDISEYKEVLMQYNEQNSLDPMELAAALAHLMHGGKPFKIKQQVVMAKNKERSGKKERSSGRDRSDNKERPRKRGSRVSDDELKTCRIEVGDAQGARKGDIVGAIANECDIDSKHIGKIVIKEDYSLIDLPDNMPKATFQQLQKLRVCGHPMKLSFAESAKSKGKPAEKPKVRKRKRPAKKQA